MDAHISNYRHRYNTKAAQKHRNGFPQIGHFSQDLIEYIVICTEKIYNRRLYPWWKKTFGESLGPQLFGFVPPQPKSMQRNISFEDVKHLPWSMRFLAVSQKSPIPYLPVQTVEEMRLYKKCVASYIVGESQDFEKMADDWNAGCLRLTDGSTSPIPDGKHIRYKIAQHLISHYRKSATAMLRKQVTIQNESDRSTIQRAINDVTIPEERFLSPNTSGRIAVPQSNPFRPNSNFPTPLLHQSLNNPLNLVPVTRTVMIAPALSSTMYSRNPSQNSIQARVNTKAPKTCKNCGLKCYGSSAHGKKGLACRNSCRSNCGNLDCKGGYLVPCLTSGNTKNRDE